MRIFVTGGTGLVGQVVVARLVRAEHQVVLLARTPQEARQGGLSQVVEGDITDPDSYGEALADCDARVTTALSEGEARVTAYLND